MVEGFRPGLTTSHLTSLQLYKTPTLTFFFDSTPLISYHSKTEFWKQQTLVPFLSDLNDDVLNANYASTYCLLWS